MKIFRDGINKHTAPPGEWKTYANRFDQSAFL